MELEGKELKNGIFKIDYENSRKVISAENETENGNIIYLTVPVYKPGENTFTIEEYVDADESPEYPRYLPVEYAENVTCNDAKRSKTVNIILNTDGSISVKE